MTIVTHLFKSSLGKKFVMAITGLVLFGFVIAHMLGNLQVFLGPDPINTYAEFLKSKPALLWAVRLGLLLMVLLHITTAFQLWRENRAARPIAYSHTKPPASTVASRTLVMSGLVILAFIIYHLMHFTVGVTHPEFMGLRDSQGRHDVYRMTVLGFSHPAVSLFYMLAMGLLCLHLSHGVSSIFQSLGVRKRTWVVIDRIAKTSALVIFIGNCSIPLAVLTGWVR